MRRALIFALLFVSLVSWAEGEHDSPPTASLNDQNAEPVVGLRPYRTTGIRVQLERFGGAYIVHNYGHGGAGITLSFGSADLAFQMARGVSVPGDSVVVIGGGVIGLTTALRLLRAGYKVTIYSDKFYPNNVSAVAGGLWSPVSVSLGGPADFGRVTFMQMQSYGEFKKLSGEEGWGVKSMPLFVSDEARENSGMSIFEEFPQLFEVQRVDRIPVKGVNQAGFRVETFLIETPVFMKRLMQEVTDLGGRMVTREFKSLEEVAEVVGKSGVAFHCTGLGARDLAKDKNVIPVRGDLVLLHKSPTVDPSNINFMAFYGSKGTDYMFPHSGKLVLGGTFLEGDGSTRIRKKTCQEIVASYNEFFGN